MTPLPRGGQIHSAPSWGDGTRAPFRALSVAALFVALTALMAYPLSTDPFHRVVNLGSDTRLFLWTLGWDLHALGHTPFSTFDANIFFPNLHTLAYSENLIGVALFSWPWLAVSGSPLFALNMAALLSCVLSGLGAYGLARELKTSVPGAIVAGVIFAFSPPRFFRIGQLHLTSVQWIPFCLLFLHRYLEGGRRRHLLAAAALFTVQAAFSGHGAVFLGFAIGALLAHNALLLPGFSWRKLVVDLGPAGLLILGLCLPLAWPYVEAKRESGFERSLAEADNGSPNAASYLASPSHVQEFLLSKAPAGWWNEDASAFLFPGYLPLVLAALALRPRPGTERAPRAPLPRDERIGVALELGAAALGLAALLIRAFGGFDFEWGPLSLSAHNAPRAGAACLLLAALRLGWAKRAPLALAARVAGAHRALGDWATRRGGPAPTSYWTLTILAFWASLGPRMGLYAVLYHVPGFNFLRIPSRIMIVALLGLAMLAGSGFDRLGEAFPLLRRRAIAGVALALVAGELAAFPIKAPIYDMEIPEVDLWLATQEGPFAIAEMPVPDPDRGMHSDSVQALYMFHSTAHWQKTVSGYSGYRPLGHAALYRTLMTFPDLGSLRALRDLGVRYVVVHKDLYPKDEAVGLDQRLDRWRGWLRLEHAFGDGRVYSFRKGIPKELQRTP